MCGGTESESDSLKITASLTVGYGRSAKTTDPITERSLQAAGLGELLSMVGQEVGVQPLGGEGSEFRWGLFE